MFEIHERKYRTLDSIWKTEKELYNDPIDLMIKIIENPKKDFKNEILKLWK